MLSELQRVRLEHTDAGRSLELHIIGELVEADPVLLAGDDFPGIPHHDRHLSRFRTGGGSGIEYPISRLRIEDQSGEHAGYPLQIDLSMIEKVASLDPILIFAVRSVGHRNPFDAADRDIHRLEGLPDLPLIRFQGIHPEGGRAIGSKPLHNGIIIFFAGEKADSFFKLLRERLHGCL